MTASIAASGRGSGPGLAAQWFGDRDALAALGHPLLGSMLTAVVVELLLPPPYCHATH